MEINTQQELKPPHTTWPQLKDIRIKVCKTLKNLLKEYYVPKIIMKIKREK